MKKYITSYFIILLTVLLIAPLSIFPLSSFAEDGQKLDKYYIYDESGNLLMEKSGVLLNDTFLTSDFTEWTIFSIDGNVALARKNKNLNKPRINIKRGATSKTNNKKICLYLTHNDESYTPTDGYDSVYGKGGIHDVAKDLKSQLENLGINVVLDETLHIPHNSTAYSRSNVTASKLQNTYNPSGLFDIHRDGVAKKYYYTENENQPFSKIRIVVGKSNPNFEENYAFAKEIFSVGQALYPWLFLDIYCGKGHYNQALQEHAILFEMGTYLIEKDLVLSSTPYLANILNTVLFNVENDSNGDITIDEDHLDDLEEDYNNRIEDNKNNSENNNQINENTQKNAEKSVNSWLIPVITIILTLAVVGTTYIFIMKKKKKNQ